MARLTPTTRCWKPEHLAIKTVNEVDTKFLGYDVSDAVRRWCSRDVKATIPDEAAAPQVRRDQGTRLRRHRGHVCRTSETLEKRAQEWDDNLAVPEVREKWDQDRGRPARERRRPAIGLRSEGFEMRSRQARRFKDDR
ncbi:MAG: hypothetical protein M5T61_18665 [Acidimicrobiia bacterium]|nr:hypothetical protein [Acidimicrobiia bacterium]